MKTDAELEQLVRVAANLVLEPVLALLQEDPHTWSDRPCSSCRTISQMVKKPFGCVLYGLKRREANKTRTTAEAHYIARHG